MRDYIYCFKNNIILAHTTNGAVGKHEAFSIISSKISGSIMKTEFCRDITCMHKTTRIRGLSIYIREFTHEYFLNAFVQHSEGMGNIVRTMSKISGR